jgi:chromosome segregation ATPase
MEDENNVVRERIESITEKSALEKKTLEEKVKALVTETQSVVEQEKKQREEMSFLIKELQSEQLNLNVTKEENAALVRKCGALGDQILELTSSIKDAETSLVVTNEQNESLRKNISEVTHERELALSKVEELSGELKLTAISLSEVQALISKDQVIAEETQRQLKSLEADKKLLEESILLIRSDKDNIYRQLELSTEEAEVFRSKWEESKSLVESLTNRCERVESEMQASEKAILHLNEKLESFEACAKAKEDLCDQLRNKIADLTAKYGEADELVKALQLENRASESAILHLNEMLESSESCAKEKEDICDQLRNTIAELTTKYGEADALVKVLQLENHRNIARCKQQDERSNSEILCLENIITSLKKEYDAFKVEAKAQLRSCEAKLESLCATDDVGSQWSQDRTFDDIVTILRKERFTLIEKLKSTVKQLEAAKKDVSALEIFASSLRREYEAFKVEAEAAAAAKIRSFESKLEQLCSFCGDNTFELQAKALDDMILMIQNELSKKSKELEVAQDEKDILDEQVCILSTEVSKFKLQNKGLLKALDDITKNM